MERRKVKNGEKSPWGQCLTRPVPTVAAVLASDWCQKNTSFLAPIRRLFHVLEDGQIFNSLIIKKLKFRSMYEFKGNVLGTGAVRGCED